MLATLPVREMFLLQTPTAIPTTELSLAKWLVGKLPPCVSFIYEWTLFLGLK